MGLEIINETREVKARKSHVCNWCKCTIPVGEKYNTQTLKYDYIYVWKSHLKCSELVVELDMDGDIGVSDEDFYNYITEECRSLIDDDIYEDKDFVIPEFKDQVEFVYEHRCINKSK